MSTGKEAITAIMQCWFLEQYDPEWDEGRGTHHPDMEQVFESKEDAQAEADRLNNIIRADYQKRREQAIERTRVIYDKEKSEHDILVAAGLRTGEFRPYKEPWNEHPRNLWSIEAIKFIPSQNGSCET